VTKAQEVYEKVEALIASGVDKSDAFKQLAEETGRPYDSLRGSYYTHKRKLEGGSEGAKSSRTRRRETTPNDALADARASLERSIASIDKGGRGSQGTRPRVRRRVRGDPRERRRTQGRHRRAPRGAEVRQRGSVWTSSGPTHIYQLTACLSPDLTGKSLSQLIGKEDTRRNMQPQP
jgi:hypothetical protein